MDGMPYWSLTFKETARPTSMAGRSDLLSLRWSESGAWSDLFSLRKSKGSSPLVSQDFEGLVTCCRSGGGERGESAHDLLVRIHCIIEIIWWTGLAP